jgi:WD40 repeat protein
VFLSYSHTDAEWVQRLVVVLKPLVRWNGLRLWVDTEMRGGDAWRSEIDAAIARSTVALLLVSADYLASDFVLDHELPALVRHGVRLAPVLVGPCHWEAVPALTGVQWLDGPNPDNALTLIRRRGRRDRRLIDISRRLQKLAVPITPAAAVPPSHAIAPADVPAVAALPVGRSRGPLSGVPGYPPGHVARSELARLIELVVAADADGGAVGITGQVPALGLHGQGGIGKSVMATALARDESVGRRFPDGIFWVSVGEHPDLLDCQIDLLIRLGDGGPAPRTVVEASDRLTEILARQRVLLIIDDVWSPQVATAFRVTGPRGRVVYTTRDPTVLDGMSARTLRVEVLPPAVARAIAAQILDISPDALPAVVDRVFEKVDRVALAVALLSAAVRGGHRWDELFAALESEESPFGDHPYANTFKAMHIATGTLSDELQEALLGLAVFPPDSRIPIEAISRYWKHTRQRSTDETLVDLDKLTRAGVLRQSDGHIEFHDLQYDYVLLHAPALSDLHAALLNAYRDLLPTDSTSRWWQLPADEPYIGDQLVRHLRGAGHSAELVLTVTDPAYLARRLAAGGPHDAEADLAQAAAHSLDPGISWWRRWIARHAHLFTPRAHPATVPGGAEAAAVDAPSGTDIAAVPTLAAWLQADRADRAHPIDDDRLRRLQARPFLTVRWGLRPPPATSLRVLTGHTATVRAVEWSPDSTRLASSGPDGVRVWHANTGRALLFLPGHIAFGTARWSPDGARLAAAGDGVVRVWDATSGRKLHHLPVPPGVVWTLEWSPDGSHLASAGSDGAVRIWDTASGRQVHSLQWNGGATWVASWSPNGRLLATGGADGVRVWDAETGRTIASLMRRCGRIWAADWAPDGSRLVVAEGTGVRVFEWAAATPRLLHKLEGHPGGVKAASWSPDASRIVSAGAGGLVHQWDATTGQLVRSLAGHADWVRVLGWTSDGARIVSAGADGLVLVWFSDSGEQEHRLTGHRGAVRAASWSPDGSRLVSAGDDGTVRIWDTTPDQRRVESAAESVVVSTATISPSCSKVGYAGRDGVVRVADAESGRHLCELSGTVPGVERLEWSPDSARVAAMGWSRVQVWDLESGRTLYRHNDWGLHWISWTPDGSRLVTASSDGWMREHDISSTPSPWRRLARRWRKYLVEPVRLMEAGTWSPDRSQLVTAEYDGSVQVWDVESGRPVRTLAGPSGPVSTVRWSRDGSRIVCVSPDASACVWDAASGELVFESPGNGRRARSLDTSEYGSWLVTVDNDGTVTARPLAGRDQQATIRLDDTTSDISWRNSALVIAGSSGPVVLDLNDGETPADSPPPAIPHGPVVGAAMRRDVPRAGHGPAAPQP